jgi:hypothetical protein
MSGIEHLRDYRQKRQLLPDSRDIIHGVFARDNPEIKADVPAVEFARSFLRLANLPNFALDRLSRYEATLWRQVSRILFALDALDRRKPQERRRRASTAAHRFGSNLDFGNYLAEANSLADDC